MTEQTKSNPLIAFFRLIAVAFKQWWFGVAALLLTLALVIDRGWLPEGTISRLSAPVIEMLKALNPL